MTEENAYECQWFLTCVNMSITDKDFRIYGKDRHQVYHMTRYDATLSLFRHQPVLENIFFWWSMEAFCIQYKSYSCAISEILEKLSSQTYTQCTLIENVYNARGCDMTDCFIYFMCYLREIFLRGQFFENIIVPSN